MSSYAISVAKSLARESAFNLESAVEHTIELMKRLGRLNSKCTLTGAENLFVYADPLNVDLVLMNLLKNAEEAVRNQQNAEIKVEIKNAGADALVIIEDNGPDMTDDSLPHCGISDNPAKKTDWVWDSQLSESF